MGRRYWTSLRYRLFLSEIRIFLSVGQILATHVDFSQHSVALFGVIKFVKLDFICGRRFRWSRGSVLAFGTQVRGFRPGRSRRIFRAKKSSARLPSEGE